MSIYRRKYRDSKTGEHRRSSRYCAEFRFRGQLYRRSGFVDRESAKHWVQVESLKLRRGEIGYVKPMHKALVAPLIEEFGEKMRKDGRDEMYSYIFERRLLRLAGECGWVTLGQVTAASLDVWKNTVTRQAYRKRVAGPKTKNQYLQAAQEFGAWLVKPKGLLPSNPLADVSPLQSRDNPGYRRAGTREELDKILAACPADRRTAYIFRLYCPLRRNTVRQLTYRMLHLDAEQPYGVTPAALNKSRREEKFPIRHELAQMLRKQKAKCKAKADDLVFPDLPTLDDFREDLIAAGVAFDDGAGSRRLDFHAMRKTLIRWCKMAGVSLDAASLLLHHKDPRTTRKHYDDDAVDPVLSDVLQKLPMIGKVRRA